jgi:D-alanyl-D-alanine dipeptidase/carboxypeptidase
MRLGHQKVLLRRKDVYRGHLILVNRDHPFRSEGENQQLDATCERQLNALLEACHANGKIKVVSGYRSKHEQQLIYETSLRENGAAFTERYVARPGESEHQTGLAVDLGENKMDLDFIRPSFPDDGVCGTFKKVAPWFGFIQRYKEGKEHITRIACEPWHYRYVGFPHAMMMEQKDLCLEEYIEYIKSYTVIDPYLYSTEKGSVIGIYYVRAEADTTEVPVLNGETYSLSGNNQDGFVVTVFSPQGCDEGGH